MEKQLEGMRVAILATDMFEESELAEPKQALEEAGAVTEILAPKEPHILAANHFDKGRQYEVDRLLGEADPANYDALLLPGGALSADALRVNPAAQHFVQQFDSQSKPIAVICHAPWLLVSAGLVKDRTLTSFHTLADDIKNAGGNWVDEPAVRDDNWISSRKPADLPLFNEEMLDLFHESWEAANFQEEMSDMEIDLTEPAFREQLGRDED